MAKSEATVDRRVRKTKKTLAGWSYTADADKRCQRNFCQKNFPTLSILTGELFICITGIF